ncbi:hypothetical protein EDD21DRAFT_353527 [Dissophora ornata]|nr:hypothetical protein BGZ58_000799 [Dissophora ornata]KAI8601605.1 hypothetical protein EDD21DRAFT_353527 [Dissophora ornata]
MFVFDLFYIAGGGSISNAFAPLASSSGSVGTLKDLIKAKNANYFHDIDADEITLWSVSISIKDEEDDVAVELDGLSQKKKLRLPTLLSKEFPDELAEEAINVIVLRRQ